MSRGRQGLGSFCTWCSSVVRPWLPSPNPALSMASPNPTLDAWSFITLRPCQLSAAPWAVSAFYSILAGCCAAVHPSLLHGLRMGRGAERGAGSHNHGQTAGIPSRQSGSCYVGRRPWVPQPRECFQPHHVPAKCRKQSSVRERVWTGIGWPSQPRLRPGLCVHTWECEVLPIS